MAAAALVAALVGASTAEASRYIQKGIYDDSQILYGNPDKVFPSLAQLNTRLIRVNLWWGGPNGVASRKPANPSNPADPAYDWATYDRTVRYAYAYKIAPIFTVIGTPSWANASAGWNAAPTNPADLQAFMTAAARRYSGKYRLPDGTTRGGRPEVDRLERAEQPGVPQPQYVRSGTKWVMQSAKDYARMCNAVVKAVKTVARLEQGRVRRHLAAG